LATNPRTSFRGAERGCLVPAAPDVIEPLTLLSPPLFSPRFARLRVRVGRASRPPRSVEPTPRDGYRRRRSGAPFIVEDPSKDPVAVAPRSHDRHTREDETTDGWRLSHHPEPLAGLVPTCATRPDFRAPFRATWVPTNADHQPELGPRSLGSDRLFGARTRAYLRPDAARRLLQRKQHASTTPSHPSSPDEGRSLLPFARRAAPEGASTTLRAARLHPADPDIVLAHSRGICDADTGLMRHPVRLAPDE
jgi:hypothetical protein